MISSDAQLCPINTRMERVSPCNWRTTFDFERASDIVAGSCDELHLRKLEQDVRSL